jgi:tetratricopeptide (TPR) repeat protein
MRRYITVFLLALTLTLLPAHAQKTEATAAANAQQWPQAVTLYKQVVDKDPSDGASWYELGAAAMQANDARTAISAFEHSLQLKNRPAFSAYNLACAHARLGEKDKALDQLDNLGKLGAPFATLVEGDSDFASLRQEPRYTDIVQRMKDVLTPCEKDPINRQFDFWVGDWEVFDTRGTRTGTSHVERSLDGCLIIENWEARLGDKGKSFNTYNPGTRKWQQYWVSSTGGVTFYEGELQDGSMRYVGTNNPRAGTPGPVRLTFTPLDGGRVRQFGEVSTDNGATWNVGYDFVYVPKK